MSFTPYRYDHIQTRYSRLSAKPSVRAVVMVLGCTGIGASAYLAYRSSQEGTFERTLPLILNLALFATLLVLQSQPWYIRRFAHFVEVNLREVAWRLPDAEKLFPKKVRIPLAQISDVRVELLRIRFCLRDGAVVDLPLNFLPYECVRALKERFAEESSFRDAFGGRIIDREVSTANTRVAGHNALAITRQRE